MELSEEVKREAFRVGYRLGIGVGKYIDWVRARQASRPAAIRESVWNEAFDQIADAACTYGNARLDKAVAELDAQTVRLTLNVFDPKEALPWLRTFTGRILSIEGGSDAMQKQFQDDLTRMHALYKEV